MPEPMTLEEQAEEALTLYTRQFLTLVYDISQRLLQHSEAIARLAKGYEKHPDVNPATGEHEATSTARLVMHDILWMVPNLGLDILPVHAAGIDKNYRQMKRLRARRTLGLPTHPPETEE